jgi:hypothetical protein
MSKKKYDFPTETVELPSKGLLYDKENPLSSGTVEMKYMTAKEEDILTNQNYIEKGTVIDKLLESLIVSNINFSDLYVGDKNALLVAARILGYGKNYTFMYNNEEVTVDLSLVENKEIDYSALESGVNEFPYTLPHSGVSVTFKFLSHKDEREIENELKGLKRLKKDSSADISTRLKHMIVSVDGESERSHVRKFVDNHLLAMDSRELRKYIKKVQPDIDLSTTVEVGRDKYKEIDIPITLNFFWPDAEL